MPLPTPRTGEDQDRFISRCMSDDETKREFPDQKQRLAVCFSQWRREDFHPDFKRILTTFIKHFKDGSGFDKFLKFVSSNGLDISKKYHPSAQFQESFQWVKPLIRFYKEDDEAKYYQVTAITANLSMNENDYSDYQKLKSAHPSLRVQPVNLNHDHSRWLDFPRTRVDFTGAEDLAVELTLRVDNEDDWLQRALDNEDIVHPSIEGRRKPDGSIEFTGLALLEKGVALPGDPLTDIMPVVLHESVQREACRLVDGELVCATNIEKGEENMGKKEQIPKIDVERAKTHFKLSDEQWNALSDEERETYIAKLPPVGSKRKTENAELRKEIIALQKKVSIHLTRENEAIKRENVAGKRIIENEALIQQLKDRIAELEATIKTMTKNHADALAKQKASFETDNAKLKTDLNKAKLEKQKLREKNLELRKTALDATSRREEYKKLMEQTTADAKLIQDENILLSEKFDGINTEVINKNSTIRSLRTELTSWKDKYRDLQETSDKTVESKDGEIDDLKEKMRDLDKDMRKRLKETKQRLDKAFAELNKRGVYRQKDGKLLYGAGE